MQRKIFCGDPICCYYPSDIILIRGVHGQESGIVHMSFFPMLLCLFYILVQFLMADLSLLAYLTRLKSKPGSSLGVKLCS